MATKPFFSGYSGKVTGPAGNTLKSVTPPKVKGTYFSGYSGTYDPKYVAPKPSSKPITKSLPNPTTLPIPKPIAPPATLPPPSANSSASVTNPPVSLQGLKKDISAKASTITIPQKTVEKKPDLVARSALKLENMVLPLSNLVSNPKTGKLTPLATGAANLGVKSVLAPLTPSGAGAPSNANQAASKEFKAATKQPSNKELATNAVAGRLFLGEGGPVIQAARGAAGIGFGGAYVKNAPQTIKAIKTETDPNKKLSLIVESLGGAALAGAGVLHLGGVIRDLPTEKTVSGEGVSVPNEQAREFFNNPNPNVDKPTQELLTKALKENKQQFVSELRSGKNISAKAPDVTVPTVYGKIITTIQSKLSRGEVLSPTEHTIVNEVTKNPEIYIPQEVSKAEPSTLFHGSDNGLLKVDDNGNVNLGTSRDEIAQFGKVVDVPTKNLTVKDVGTKANLFQIAGDPLQKAELVKQGVDIIKAENHAIAINPDNLAKQTGNGLRPSPRSMSIGDLMATTAKDIPVGSRNIPMGEPRSLQPIGEGQTKTSTLAQSVNQKAIDEKLTNTLGGLPEYNQVNMKQQAKMAADLLSQDEEKAVRIAKGQEIPPNELLPESVFIAVENKALQDGNTSLLRELATSSLTTEATAMGQRIRALAEREPDSVVSAIKKVNDARSIKLKEKSKTLVKTAVKEIKKSVPKVKKETWTDFVSGLEC